MYKNIFILSLMGLLIGCNSNEPIDADKAIANVHVISMNDEEIQENRTVFIKDDRIVKIAEENQHESEDAEVIDGKGRYLIPGLSEMHAHIPSGDADQEYIQDVLFLYLTNGITTIRGMLGDPLHLELRQKAAQENVQSPRIYTSGPGFSGNAFESAEQARQQVRDQHEAGYDFLKIFPGLTLEEYNAIADEAKTVGIEFSGHIPLSVGLERAIKAGQKTIDHLDKYPEALLADDVNQDEIDNPGVIYFGMHLTPHVDRDKISDIATQTKEAGTWNVPTQALLEHVLGPEPAEEMAQRPEFQYMPSETVVQWIESKKSITDHKIYSEELAQNYLQLRRDILKALHDKGAGLLLGSDAPQIFNVPGFSVHHELQYLVDAGLTPYEALQTGTYNAAEYLDDMQNRGTIEEGKIADMVLLKENPLKNIANSKTIVGVMYRGHWLDQETIENKLNDIATRNE